MRRQRRAELRPIASARHPHSRALAQLALPLCWLLTAGLVLAAGPAHCQQATSVQMQVQSQRVVMGDALVVRVIARGEFDEITPPSSTGFDFRQTGRSSQMSIIGAQVTRSLVLTFQGTPRRPGKWPVLGAVLTRRGKTVARANTVTVTVLDDRAAMGPALAPEQAMQLGRYSREQFFVRPVLSTTSPYVGQPVVLTYELYWARGAGVQGIRELSEAKFSGFEAEDLLGGQPQRQQQVRIGGRIFARQVTRKMLLVAAEAGTFEVLGPRYRIDIGDIFDSRAVKIGPPPVAITVREVPEAGRPKSYVEDAIGELSLRGHFVKRGAPTKEVRLKPGERAVLRYEVSGRGNLLSLPTIKPPEVPGMTVTPLPDRADRAVKRTPQGVEGKRIWQYLVSFERPGTVTLPALTWSHFNPKTGHFATTQISGLKAIVDGPASVGAAAPAGAGPAAATAQGKRPSPAPPAGGQGDGARSSADAGAAPGAGHAGGQPSAPAAAAASRSGQPTATTTNPLVPSPLATDAGLARTAHRPFTQAPWFWPTSGAPWAGGVLMLLLWGLRRRQRAAQPARAQQGALSAALAALEAAADHGALRAAVATYLQVRAQLHLPGLTSSSLRTALEARGAPADAARQLADQLTHCDYARYAPDGGSDDLRDTGRQIGAALRAIDAALGGSRGGARGRASAALIAAIIVGGGALGAPQVAHAATLDQSFQAANAAYTSGDFAAARRGYEALLTHGLHSAAIHYNLGNVLMRTNHLGAALGHFRQAQRLAPSDKLAADIAHNLTVVRRRLAERSRRNHRVLHIFDESPELDVALARAAPRRLLGLAALATGWAALLLFGVLLFAPDAMAPRRGWLKGALAGLVLVQLAAAGWLAHAQRVDHEVHHAVVVQEDAGLTPCVGGGEQLDLPEGLEVRVVRQRPDGRVEVRLPNGRSGCVTGEALTTIAERSL